MARPEEPISLSAFVEQTAKMLREAASSALKKTRSFSKKTDLSTSNKIEQIAFFLRLETKKKKRNPKKKSR